MRNAQLPQVRILHTTLLQQYASHLHSRRRTTLWRQKPSDPSSCLPVLRLHPGALAAPVLVARLLLTNTALPLWCSMARQWTWQTGSAASVPSMAHLMAYLRKSRLHPPPNPRRGAADPPRKCCRGYEVRSDTKHIYSPERSPRARAMRKLVQDAIQPCILTFLHVQK